MLLATEQSTILFHLWCAGLGLGLRLGLGLGPGLGLGFGLLGVLGQLDIHKE